MRNRLLHVMATSAVIVCLIAAAATTAAAAPAPKAAVNMNHCQNGSPFALTNFVSACGSTAAQAWTNGDLNFNNSQYREGDSVPYQALITGLTNGTWTIRLDYAFTAGGSYALDRLTRYNLTQAADPCAGTSNCAPAFTFNMPGEAVNVGAGVPALANSGSLSSWSGSPLAGNLDNLGGIDTANSTAGYSSRMTVWTAGGGTASFVSVGQNWTGTQSGSFNDNLVFQNGLASGNSDRDFAFEVTVSGCPTAGCELVLGWSTHIASAFDWGANKGAASIKGAPYHMKIVGVDQADGNSGGNQDESFQNSLITQTLTVKKACSTSDTFNLLIAGTPYANGVQSSTGVSCGGSTQTIGVVGGTANTISETGNGTTDMTIYNSTWSCTDATSGSGQSFTETVASGANIFCTFTNTPKTHLTLTDSVTNNWGGTATQSSFTLTATGATGATSSLSGAGSADSDVLPGDYTLTESSVSGYTAGTWSCTGGSLTGNVVTLALGDRVSCSISNSDQAATVVIVANTTGPDGTFAYTVSGPTASTPSITTSGNTGSNTLTPISAGTYTVAETVPSTWILNSYSCTSGSASAGTATWGFSVPLGGTVTCTFNQTARTHLTLADTVDNTWGGNAVPANFTVSATLQNTATAALSGAGGADGDVTPGTYTLAETSVLGYATGTWSCTAGTLNGNQLTLPIGTYASCSIGNAAIPGTIVLIVNTRGGDGTFTFNVSGPSAGSPTVTTTGSPNGTGTTTDAPVIAGVYSVSQLVPTGWALTDFTCSSGAVSQTSPQNIPTQWTFTVPLASTVTCTLDDNYGATRTQGFWATHTQLANAVWGGSTVPFPASGISPVTGSGDEFLCTTNALTAVPATSLDELMGGFWASISQTSTGGKRSSIDQARMQMLQQYLAAVLNVHMFGSGNEGMLATARSAYCGNSVTAIQAQTGILGTFNASADSTVFTPGSSATAPMSKSEAYVSFWDKAKQ